ncbi:Uncharacterized protein Adt_41242 [Abeliophyllum distichum]|uniref:Uncharacterized protein n=1 Tax=Abeliophyllum distichum TaxID=126358 RepID=A0ABD1PNB3_9LAMI
MFRRPEHQGTHQNGWDSPPPTSEYIEYVTQRKPIVFTDVPHSTNVHDVYDNKVVYTEKFDPYHHHENSPVKHHEKYDPYNHHENSPAKHHEQRYVPEGHKKVHFVEHTRSTEIDRDGKHEVYEEKTIDMEADGYIQQKHKNFDNCNRGAFKAYYD